jgi:hypothetical protein
MSSEPPVSGPPGSPEPDQAPQTGFAVAPYQYAHPYPYQFHRRTNLMAILSLVFAFVFSPAAIVVGHIARKQIRETGEDGDGLALAGLIVGYILTGISVALCGLYAASLIGILAVAVGASV